ncbi:MAG TPA: 50S ribosomal protein L9 [Treponemataceae bacterium]|nr:50S ribosomal protein L9 [Treponemataceae bacterium]HPS44822.1 50S ribosomal protein L9 [Treponemataceae bacterium]
MKVILNQDVKHLGEEGDVKDVANGYARNFLFPRNLAVPCNDRTLAYFESRKAEIEAKKAAKRADAASLKEKLEATVLTLIMPAGSNGKLYGAVTNQTLVDEFKKAGYEIERKRIEVPGLTFKSVGKYHVTVHLYEGAAATVQVIIEAQPEAEQKSAPKAERAPRRRHEEASEEASPEAAASEQAPAQDAE